MTSIKVAIISDGYMSGGASIAALRLQQGLSQGGAKVLHLLAGKDSNDGSIINYERSTLLCEFIKRIANLFKRKDVAQSALSILYRKRIEKEIRTFAPDVINMHNLHGVFSTPALLQSICRLNAPVVWTLHDMWALTGHCAYALDCRKYRQEGCERDCPDPERYPALIPSKISKAFRQRARLYGQLENLSVITPSNWLAGEVKKGLLGKKEVRVIPNGIDVNLFEPIDRTVARAALGLPQKQKIMLTGSFNLKSERKGWPYLESVMQDRFFRDVRFMAYGTDNGRPDQLLPFELQMLGYINDERLLRLYYSAADVFVLSSLADNLPNVLIESIACGTPCVAFDAGGIADVVRNGITGFLAEYRNSNDLADKIRRILDMKSTSYDEMSSNCRKIAEQEYNIKFQAAKYQDHFNALKSDQQRCKRKFRS